MPIPVSITLVGPPNVGKSSYLLSLGLTLKQNYSSNPQQVFSLKEPWQVKELDDNYKQQIQQWTEQYKIKKQSETSGQWSFELLHTESGNEYRVTLVERSIEDILSCLEDKAKLSNLLGATKDAYAGVLWMFDYTIFSGSYLSMEVPKEQAEKSFKDFRDGSERFLKVFQPYKPIDFLGVCLMKADELQPVQQRLEAIQRIVKDRLNRKTPYLCQEDLEEERMVQFDTDVPPLKEFHHLLQVKNIRTQFYYISALGLPKYYRNLEKLEQFVGYNVCKPIVEMLETVEEYDRKKKDCQTIVAERETELNCIWAKQKTAFATKNNVLQEKCSRYEAQIQVQQRHLEELSQRFEFVQKRAISAQTRIDQERVKRYKMEVANLTMERQLKQVTYIGRRLTEFMHLVLLVLLGVTMGYLWFAGNTLDIHCEVVAGQPLMGCETPQIISIPNSTLQFTLSSALPTPPKWLKWRVENKQLKIFGVPSSFGIDKVYLLKFSGEPAMGGSLFMLELFSDGKVRNIPRVVGMGRNIEVTVTVLVK